MEHRLEEAPIGIVTVQEGIVRACNKAAAGLLGVDAPTGQPVADVFPESVGGSLLEAFDGSSGSTWTVTFAPSG